MRERSNHKHGRFVSRFEQLALHPRLHHNEGFPICTIPQDHSTLQVLSLRPTSSSLVPARTQYMNPQARLEAATFNHSQSILHGHDTIEMDTTRNKFLKIHVTRVSDTFQIRHGFLIGMPFYIAHITKKNNL